MNVRVENAGPCRKKLFINAGAEEVEKEYNHVLNLVASEAEIKGFRKGKAPRELVAKEYSAEIEKRTRNMLLNRLYDEAVQKEKIKDIEIISIKMTDFSREKGISFVAEVDVQPEFELPDYKAIKVKKNTITIDEKDVDNAIENLRVSCAKYEEIPSAKAENGDVVIVDFEGTSDGIPLKLIAKEDQWLGESKDRMLIVGAKREIIPGLNEAIQGAERGKIFEFDTEFPSDYFIKEVAGKKAHYKIMVKSVRKQLKPELDDKFFAEFGAKDMEDLRNHLRESLKTHAEREETQRVKDKIIEQLLQMSSFDIPQSMKETETKITLYQMVHDLARRGMDKKTIDEQRDKIFNEAAMVAERKIKISYLLYRIAEKEQLLATKEEVDQALNEIAKRRKTKVEIVKKEFDRENKLVSLEHDITIDKTLDFLMEKVAVVNS